MNGMNLNTRGLAVAPSPSSRPSRACCPNQEGRNFQSNSRTNAPKYIALFEKRMLLRMVPRHTPALRPLGNTPSPLGRRRNFVAFTECCAFFDLIQRKLLMGNFFSE